MLLVVALTALASAQMTATDVVQMRADTLWSIQQTGNALIKYCWRSSYGRGVGNVLGCAEGLELDGGLCYPPCREGYHGVADICWQNCPEGFTDTGADCLKPPSYGRGAGYVIWDHGKCVSENPQGCEKWGAMWYPLCRSGFHPVACCVCSPDCPAGYKDIGVSCQVQSYSRGVGTPITTCTNPNEEKSGALCYPTCKDGFHGVGPVCWSNCGGTLPYSCAAGCATDSTTCGWSIFEMVESVAKMALDIIEAAFSDGASGVAQAALKGVIIGAISAGVDAVEDTISYDEAAAHMRTAAQQSYDKLTSTYGPTILPILQEQWPDNSSMPQAILDSAAWHVAYASISSKKYNLLDFVEEAAPFNIGNVIKAFDKPLCSVDLPPQSCSDIPAVCNNSGQCSGNWSCSCQQGWTGPDCSEPSGEEPASKWFNKELSTETLTGSSNGDTYHASSGDDGEMPIGTLLPIIIAACVVGVVVVMTIALTLRKKPTESSESPESTELSDMLLADSDKK